MEKFWRLLVVALLMLGFVACSDDDDDDDQTSQPRLTVTLAGEGSGTVTSAPEGIDCGDDCAETFDEGESVTLTATAASGSDFAGWSGACSGSTGNTCTLTMDVARGVTATFTPEGTSELTVTLAGDGNGTVTSSTAGIDCGADCSESVNNGDTVTLTATAAAGSTFAGWSGACAGSTGNVCTVTVDNASAVTATFTLEGTVPPKLNDLTVTRLGDGAGTVTSTPAGINCGGDCSETYAEGTAVTLTASAAAGSEFAGWSGACAGSTGTTCTVTMTADQTASATFNAEVVVGDFMTAVGTFRTGVYDEGAAEIVAYDPTSRKLFVVNGNDDTIDVLDAGNPAAPTRTMQISLAAYGAGANSVAVKNGIVAAAVEANDKQADGSVVFFDTNGTFLNSVPAGALPDMITFTPDGTKVLVANEGEPNADYTVDPEGSVTIVDISAGVENATATTATFTAFNALEAELRAAGVRISGPGATVAMDVEPEYIAVSADSTRAWVALQENNAIAVIDIPSATVLNIAPMGYKDHNARSMGLDASNRDGMINIRNWPVFGMYMPDSIAAFEIGGTTYLVTANEGDSREYFVDANGNDEFDPGEGHVDETRIGDVTLDPAAFPNAAELQNDAALGRLKITNTMGDADGDGDYDRLYSFGARSFTVWRAEGNSLSLVYDSGDAFERIIAERYPSYFNIDEDEFDGRSDDKGPEPEGIIVGVVNGRTYAFIGLERMGGIMVYDVTNPAMPAFIQYINNQDFTRDVQSAEAGDIGPEGLLFIPAADTPTGTPWLAVANEVSGTTTLFNIDPTVTRAGDTTLQLLHASDLEGGVDAVGRAPNFAALADYFDETYASTLIISAGDNYISGPFNSAAADGAMRSVIRQVLNNSSAREGAGRVDLSIMNIIGFHASAFGNHEFDQGTGYIRDLIGTDIRDGGEARWLGAEFPYLSANLDFSGDGNLSGLKTDQILGYQAFESLLSDLDNGAGKPLGGSKIAEATIIQTGTATFGVVGGTTPLLESISSPGETTVENPGAGTNDIDAFATHIQPWVDQLLAMGIDKIIVTTHLQQIALEQELIGKLRGVDIVIAGGSDTLLADENDTLRGGDAAAGPYPIVTTNADGDPAVIVSTDGEYGYVGRLVVTFDANGRIRTNAIDPAVSGAYVTTDEKVTEVWGGMDAFAAGTRGGDVKTLTDAVSGIVTAKDSIIHGETTVYLNGARVSVRTEETNLGNLSADANLAAAMAIDNTARVSIKNGGGIRAAIGEVVEVSPGVYEEVPPQANPLAGKQTGQISQLDIENAFRFNNTLSLVTVTPAGLLEIVEHGVSAVAPGATPGQFPQIGGMRFSFDPAMPAGDRVVSLAIVDDMGNITDTVVQNGAVVGDANREIRIVTLGFLAAGGDGYPFDTLGTNVVDTGIGEQTAMADFLTANHGTPGTAYSQADTPAAQDERIQNLSVRADTVLDGGTEPPDEMMTITGAVADGKVRNCTVAFEDADGEALGTTTTGDNGRYLIQVRANARRPFRVHALGGFEVVANGTERPFNAIYRAFFFGDRTVCHLTPMTTLVYHAAVVRASGVVANVTTTEITVAQTTVASTFGLGFDFDPFEAEPLVTTTVAQSASLFQVTASYRVSIAFLLRAVVSEAANGASEALEDALKKIAVDLFDGTFDGNFTVAAAVIEAIGLDPAALNLAALFQDFVAAGDDDEKETLIDEILEMLDDEADQDGVDLDDDLVDDTKDEIEDEEGIEEPLPPVPPVPPAPPTTNYTLTVTLAGDGLGTVTDDGGQINCGADCAGTYGQGTSVTLTATPEAGYDFTGWSGSCSGTDACTVTMTGTRNVVATFDLSDEITAINAIQGAGDESTLVGQTVTVQGVVTGAFPDLSGYFVQGEMPDADPATSEGIFVFDTGNTPAVGDLVRFDGEVEERFGQTQLKEVANFQVLASGIAVMPMEVNLPFEMSDGTPYPERYEGMFVTMPQTLTVSEVYNLGRFGEMVLSSGRLMNPTNVAMPGMDADEKRMMNALNRIFLDDGDSAQNPDPVIFPAPELTAANTLRTGHTVTGLTGVINYAFSEYRVQPTETPVFSEMANPRTEMPMDVGGTLKVASFNVLNYFSTIDDGNPVCGPNADQDCRGADSADEFDRQRTKIIEALAAIDADVVGLMEIENHPTDAALMDLVDGLNDEMGAGTYDYVDIGVTGDDAIKVAMIFKPGMVTPKGTPATTIIGEFDDKSRQPLAQTFEENATGEQFIVVVNHLKSKGSCPGDDMDINADMGQGCWNHERNEAAKDLLEWLATDPTGTGDMDVLIIGDLNSYLMEDPIRTIEEAGYANLLKMFVDDPYTYVFEAEAGVLDHALASPGLAPAVTGATAWHVNADEPRVLDYNVEFKSAGQVDSFFAPDPFRASDHDPVIVGLNLAAKPLNFMPTAFVPVPEGVAEIVVSVPGGPSRGEMLLYSDAGNGTMGMIDITVPAMPMSMGVVDVTDDDDHEPTSLAVTPDGKYVLVVVRTGDDENNANPGLVRVYDIEDPANVTFVTDITVGIGPDSIAIAETPKGMETVIQAVVAIEDEEDDLPGARPGRIDVIKFDMDDPSASTVTSLDVAPELAGAGSGVNYAADPQPEYVAISPNGMYAAVTIQENNALAIVNISDPDAPAIERVFSLGTTSRTMNADLQDDGEIVLNQSFTGRREADGVYFLPDGMHIVTANEGDTDFDDFGQGVWSGGRNFTVFDLEGNVVYEPGATLDELAVILGHYPDGRSDARGIEVEGVTAARLLGMDYLFAASERGSFVAVFMVDRMGMGTPLQVLPTDTAPEGIIVVKDRADGKILLVTANEEFGTLNIFEASDEPVMPSPMEPTIQSTGTDIPWGALSGMTNDGQYLYAVPDNAFTHSRIYKIDPAKIATEGKAEIVEAIMLMDGANPVEIDPEGIVWDGTDFWIASEGGTPEENKIHRFSPDGMLQETIDFPGGLLPTGDPDVMTSHGFEGIDVSSDGRYIYTAVQRGFLKSDNYARILRYDTRTDEWISAKYPMETIGEAWKGLSEITLLDDDKTLLVVERDKGAGNKAGLKWVTKVDLSGMTDEMTLTKELVADLLADDNMLQEKVECMTVFGGNIWIANDNDGAGWTRFINIGPAEMTPEPRMLLINEMKINLPDDEDDLEFFELRGEPNTNVGPDTWFVNVLSGGEVHYAVDLSGTMLGPNGLLVIKNPAAYPDLPMDTAVINDARLTGNDDDGAILHDAQTFMIVKNAPNGFPIGEDLDATDDGVLDSVNEADILDSMGWLEDGDGVVYTTALLDQPSSTPDAAVRLGDNDMPKSMMAWANGDLLELEGDPNENRINPLVAGATLPSGAAVTPGSPNFLAAPFVVMNEVSIKSGATPFIELLTNEKASFDNVYAVVVDGTGDVRLAEMVSATAGESGLVLLQAPGAAFTPNPNATVLTVNALAAADLSGEALTFLLVYSPMAMIAQGDDFDTNDDGTPDALPDSAQVLDAIAWKMAGSSEFIYADTDLSIGDGMPEGATRLRGFLFAGSSPWGAGQILPIDNRTYDTTSDDRNIGLPLDTSDQILPRLTPGGTNISPLGAGIVPAELDLPRTTVIPPDTDDPAFWVHPTDVNKSLIFVSQKEAGFSVYDVEGNVVADVAGGGPADPIGRNVRFNNVDVVYGFDLNGTPTDLILFSDRENDTLVVYGIDPLVDAATVDANTIFGTLLTELTAPEKIDPDTGKIFTASEFDPATYPGSDVEEGDTAYGLCAYNSPVDDAWYVFVTRNDAALVYQLRLEATAQDQVTWTKAREIVMTAGDDDAQAEGLVADHQKGVVYIGQEEVAVYRVNAEPDDVEAGTGYKLLTADYMIEMGKEFADRLAGEQVNLIPDIEGIALYYGAGDDGYLIVSAQGVNTFALYERNFAGDRTTVPQVDGNANAHVVNFAIEGNGLFGAAHVDGIQETDGLDVINIPFGPTFPSGVLCTQDGQGYDAVDDSFATNVKCVGWNTVVDALGIRVEDTTGYNPRTPN